MSRSSPLQSSHPWRGEVRVESNGLQLEGTLDIPADARGLVLFAHGSGSSRHSARNRHVAGVLRDARLGTFLFDLLTRQEELWDTVVGNLRFDIALLATRLEIATRWAIEDDRTAPLRIGYFGASTGAAAALIAATTSELDVGAVVSRGGRPDLAQEALGKVRAPTLLIVGGADEAVIKLNEQAYVRLVCVKRFEIVPGATHLFEEPGALDRVAALAASWFAEHLPRQEPRP
jgi:pimeloyl-ACP methyl ester carboxylesterase